MDIIIKQLPPFKKAYKKLKPDYKKKVDRAINNIVADPSIGEIKKGDLSGFCVYKFKLDHQEILLAYNYTEPVLTLVVLGVHENFYRDLKRLVN
jgi:mRNA-degrading endonuclease RelE of RelBE toxin-antitoxin system